MTDNGIRLIAAAIALLPMFAVALALGNIFSNWLTTIGRNPTAADKMQQTGLLGFALTEAIALFSLIVAFLILFVG